MPLAFSGARLAVGLAAGALLLLPTAARAQSPTVTVTVNATQFSESETLAMGVTASNPPGNPAADLYIGILLPGGQTQIYFTGPGTVSAPLSSLSPASFPRFQAAPAGFSLSAPDFFQFTFPELGVPPGTYFLFATLARQGALADNRIDPADVLAIHQVGVNFGEAFSLEPGDGPSGTLVSAQGSGFTPSARVTVGGVAVSPVIVSSPSTVSFTIPYTTQGTAPAPLAAGPVTVQIDNRPVQTFNVTSLPANPSPPGTLLQGAVTATGSALGSSASLIDATLTSLATDAATQQVTAYTNAMQSMLADLQAVFQQDLGGLSGELDTATLGLVESSLIDPPPPPPADPAAVAALPGDVFLQQRLALIQAGNRAGRSALALSTLCPASPSRLCKVAAAAFSITNLTAALLVGSLGSVTGLDMDSNLGVERHTPTQLFIRLRTGQTATLSPTLITNRVVNGLDPVKLALRIRTARTFINQVLAGPGVPAGLAGRLQRLGAQLGTLDALGAALTADVPIGGATRRALSFVNLKGSCPDDFLANVSLNGVAGTVRVNASTNFAVTRLCTFRVQPVFVSEDESTVTFGVWVTVQP